MPREVSDLLDRRAKAENTTLSGIFLAIVENHMDDDVDALDDAEDRHLSKIADERYETETEYVSHEEAWK